MKQQNFKTIQQLFNQAIEGVEHRISITNHKETKELFRKELAEKKEAIEEALNLLQNGPKQITKQLQIGSQRPLLRSA